jgi:AraC-like DNA-binding protein
MLAQDYFTLKLVRLNSADDWSFKQDGLCILLTKGGAGKLVIGSATQRLTPGDVLILNGTAGGRLHPVDGVEIIFWCFSLRLDQLYPLFAGGEISLLEGVADALHQPRHFPAALPLAQHCHRLVEDIPPQFDLDHRSQLLRIASVILTEEFKTLRERRAGSLGIEQHMLQIFERLSADELLTISVGELAAKFSCSRRHLNRLFHQYFGFSVASLRMEMRLLKAVSLLRDANAKVINVAEQCGFNHLGLFNTCFKRRFGVSPGQWRKQGGTGLTPAAVPTENISCPLHSKGLCPLTGAAAGSLSLGPAVTSLLHSNLARPAAGGSTGSAKAPALSPPAGPT